MFSVDELSTTCDRTDFLRDMAHANAALASHRLRQPYDFAPDAAERLTHFVEAVLVSAPSWTDGAGQTLLESAAQIAETISRAPGVNVDSQRLRLRSALLYELAGLPMMAAAVIDDRDVPRILIDFFRRKSFFRSLGVEFAIDHDQRTYSDDQVTSFALGAEAVRLGMLEQNSDAELGLVTKQLERVASGLSLDWSVTELRAFTEILHRRARNATVRNVRQGLVPRLMETSFPAELWDNQRHAIQAGLLDETFDAWSFASPTGTGKTFIARLLIMDGLAKQPNARVLYIVPSKALVYQVTRDLSRALEPVGITVQAVTPRLADLESDESGATDDANVLVLTPEKADLLLRIGVPFLSDVALTVVDEAHHVEADTRGVLLEFYLWRLRMLTGNTNRYVFLSAVAPNVKSLAEWMGTHPGGDVVDKRATRMKVGVFRRRKEGSRWRGFIDYTDGTVNKVISGTLDRSSSNAGIAQLAVQLAVAGPVLIVAKGKGTAESIAKKLLDVDHVPLTREQLVTPEYRRLDSRLEREMYASVPMRQLVAHGIAYHHAGLPPRVREAVEDAIGRGLIKYVVATTTLGEGVNFPFSSVIVQSLATREFPEAGKPASYRVLSVRNFWNIAGRAGRPGYDAEGQVILFEPSLGLEHVNAVLEPYTDPSIKSIAPVESALAKGLRTIADLISTDGLAETQLGEVKLATGLPRDVQGAVNLIRVGVAHARASNVDASAEQIIDSTFASEFLTGPYRAAATRIVDQQLSVVDRYLERDDAPPLRLVAELGLSLETLDTLQDYVRKLEDGFFESMITCVVGGTMIPNRASWVVGPVMQLMSNLEGKSLSVWVRDIVMEWLSGVPFSSVKPFEIRGKAGSLEDLIRIIYSEVQYMLPWGLYALDRFAEEEADRRGMPYDRTVAKLSHLVDGGVPNFSALRLVNAGFERVDATRIAKVYNIARADSPIELGGWLRSVPLDLLARYVRGDDRRPLDYDFERLVSEYRDS
ncbi:MAG: DEAD/DEAH box helicase [Thermoleophilia bacterium]|nr:DEAD/DEAH box helicase [Thermoleophilia bacterium]